MAIYIWTWIFAILQLSLAAAPLHLEGPSITLFCGVEKDLCLEKQLMFQCNVSSTILKWIIGPDLLEITVSNFDKKGYNRTISDFTVVLSETGPLFLSSEIYFNATEKYNNTKIYCSDGISGNKSEAYCKPTLYGVPGKVQNLNGKINKDQLNLSWLPAKTFREQIITHYRILVTPPPGDGNCATGECNTTETKFSVTKLPSCKNYAIYVEAFNCAGFSGKPSQWLVEYESPSAVQNLSIAYDGHSVDVTWTAPQNAGGLTPDEYIVTVEPTPQSGNCSGGECIVDGNSLTLSNLEPCLVYTVFVEAANCYGAGPRVSNNLIITNDNEFNFSVQVLHKIIHSCNDTVTVEYEWTGCSPISVDFLIVYMDGYHSEIQNDVQNVFVQPGYKKTLALPINFNFEANADYFFSIIAYNKGAPLTDVKIGYLSSKALCSNGNEQSKGPSENWKLPFIITSVATGALLLLFAITFTTMCAIFACKRIRNARHRLHEDNTN